MNKPRAVCAFLFRTAIFALATLFVFNSPIDLRAQQTIPKSSDTAQGIQLYKQGNDGGAIEVQQLSIAQHKDDANAWYYLGLALSRSHKSLKAREAFEQTLKLRPDFAEARAGLAYVLFVANKLSEAEQQAKRALQVNPRSVESHYVIGAVQLRHDKFAQALEEAEAALKVNPTYIPALLLKTQSLISSTNEGVVLPRGQASRIIIGEEDQILRATNCQLFSKAAVSLQQYLRLIPKNSESTNLRELLEKLEFYARDESASDEQSTLFRSSEVDTKAVVLSRPLPPFSEATKVLGGANSMVIARAVLDSSGAVKYILVTKSSGYGFMQAVTNAAREIRFKPAIKNGHPVSQMVTIIYGYYSLN